MRDREQVCTQRQPLVHDEAMCLVDRADTDVGHGQAAPAEQDGGDVCEHAVREPGGEERAGERRAALHEQRLDAARVQLGEDRRQVVRVEEQRRVRMTMHRRIRRGGTGADHDRDGLVRQELVAGAGGERGVVGEHGAGTHRDRVGLGASPVHIGAGLRAGDPLTGTVVRRSPAVEALRPLDGHVRTAEARRDEPVADHGAGLGGALAGLHAHARGAQPLRAAAGDLTGVVERVDDPRHAGLDERERAGAGATGVIAGFQRHDRRRAPCSARRELREGVDLGVRGAGAPMPALGQHLAVGGEDHGAHLRVDPARAAGREGERTIHRTALCRGHCHPSSSSLRLGVAAGWRNGRTRVRLVLPPFRTSEVSLASPSVPEFHRIGIPITRNARGLSPPVRIPTDPGARCCSECTQRVCARFIPWQGPCPALT
ncbi:protein of unknown function [Microbacterium sp. Nx66]|nr:protein of unknown function [Microbacterium sp. Nx66]